MLLHSSPLSMWRVITPPLSSGYPKPRYPPQIFSLIGLEEHKQYKDNADC